jgi:single-stranded DNA-binding protein
MAADNHTTIVGNLVEDPELRFIQTAWLSPTCAWP